MWTVYMHKCPNNKVYIGITSTTTNRRWNNGKSYSGSRYFNNAIHKYGWDNIEHTILYENLTKDEACQKEIELIQKYKSNNPDYGYNLSAGGDCGNYGHKQSKEFCQMMSQLHKGKIVSEETREKIRKGNTGKKMKPESIEKTAAAHRGKPLSEEHKAKISNALKGRKNGPRSEESIRKSVETRKKNGYRHSDETKRKISNAHKGKKHPMSEETKRKLSESMKESYRRRKNL